MQTEGENKISSPEEELEALRKRVAELESVSSGKEKPEAIKEAIKEHAEKNPKEVFSPEFIVSEEESKEHAEKISGYSPEKDHEEVINDLLEIAKDKGVYNAVSIAKNLDPHLEDDFHDALVKHFQNIKNR